MWKVPDAYPTFGGVADGAFDERGEPSTRTMRTC
jgi:hypothetical protein